MRLQKRLTLTLIVLSVLTLALSAIALASPVPDPAVDLPTYLSSLLSQLSARDWMAASGLLVIGLVWSLRAKIPLVRYLPWLGTKWGGWVLSFTLASLAALGSYMFGHMPWLTAIKQAVITGFLAAGGWEMAKDINASMQLKKK